MSLGPHASFILASYGAVAVIVGGLLVWLVQEGKRYQRRLDELEQQGIRRRSAGEGNP